MIDPYAGLAELYDFEHDPFADDIGLYRLLAQRSGGPVLDVGCGTGRVARALAESGHQVTGLDVSEPMLAAARARTPLDLEIVYVRGSAGMTDLGGKFGLIIFTLDTFAHLTSLDEQDRVLRWCRALLKPTGLLVIDLSAPDPGTWRQEDNLVVHAWTREGPEGSVRKSIARTLEEMEQLQTIQVWYDRWADDGPVRRTHSELVLRYFFPAELRLLLDRANLAVDAWYGDYDESDLTSDSPRLIVVAKPVGDTPR